MGITIEKISGSFSIGGKNIKGARNVDVEVNGKVCSINSKNGNITCGEVAGNVESKNGNITCGSVKGDVCTKNGCITRNNYFGNVGR